MAKYYKVAVSLFSDTHLSAPPFDPSYFLLLPVLNLL